MGKTVEVIEVKRSMLGGLHQVLRDNEHFDTDWVVAMAWAEFGEPVEWSNVLFRCCASLDAAKSFVSKAEGSDLRAMRYGVLDTGKDFEIWHIVDDGERDAWIPYQDCELEALLGDFVEDFDFDGLRDALTTVKADGGRYWLDYDLDETNAIIERFQKPSTDDDEPEKVYNVIPYLIMDIEEEATPRGCLAAVTLPTAKELARHLLRRDGGGAFFDYVEIWEDVPSRLVSVVFPGKRHVQKAGC